MKQLRTALLFGLAAVSAFGADTGLLKLVDPGTKVLAGVQVDRSASSQFGRFVLDQMQADDATFKRFVDSTGFDPRHDLREVIVASNDTAKSGHGLVVARGTFDIAKLTAAVTTQGGAAQKYSGVDLLQSPKSHGDGWIGLLDYQTVVAGDEATVKAAIDRRGKPGAIDPKLMAKVQEMSIKYDAWLVSMAPVSHFAGAIPDSNLNGALKGDVMQGISMTSGGVSFGSVVQIFAEAVARSEKDAQALMDVAKFITGMVQLNRDKAEMSGIATILDTLDLKMNAQTVTMSLGIPEAHLEKLIREGNTHKTAPKASTISYRP